MITAKDVSKLLDEYDPKIDEVIERIVVPKFLEQHTRSIKIDAESLNLEFNNYVYIISQFKKRGFRVEVLANLPCGVSWYEISLPPADE